MLSSAFHNIGALMVNEPSQPSQDSSGHPRTIPAWYKTALVARPKLEKLSRGERGNRINQIAKELGVNSADTLQRYVAAANFLDRFRDVAGKYGYQLAPTTSVSAIELIARWFAYDPEASIHAAALLASGHYSVLHLRAKERAARLAYAGTRTGRSGAHLLRQKLKSIVEELIARGASAPYIEDLPRRYEPTRIDFLFRSAIDPLDRIAVLIFGPFSDERQYLYKEEEFLVRILGLSRVYKKLVGIVPNHKRWRTDFEAWLDHYSDLNITFHYLDLTTHAICSPRAIHA